MNKVRMLVHLIPAVLFALLFSNKPVLAQVSFDGSIGPAGTLSGDMLIPDTYGTQVGGNLFHSFGIFNIRPGESATFTSTYGGATNHVIGRITGGDPSTIAGPLINEIPGASLWLINPSGVVFNEGASIDVQGSFYASTADYLLLDDGGKFSAHLADVQGTVLTMGNPASFGFLTNSPAAIVVNGTELAVPHGQSLVLAGGDIDLSNATLRAGQGMIGLAGIAAAGEIGIAPGGFSALVGNGADITLDASTLDTDGEAAGDIYISGGRFVMRNGSAMQSRSGALAGGVVEIAADQVILDEDSVIDADAHGSGAGTSVSISAIETVLVQGGSVISAGALADGDAGGVTVTAGEAVRVAGQGGQNYSAIQAGTVAGGDGATVSITAPTVELIGGGHIWTATNGFGRGGDVTVNSSNNLLISGHALDGFSSGIYTSATEGGNAGDVYVNTGDLGIYGGATIFTRTRGFGNGGDITIRATGDLDFSGRGLFDDRGALFAGSTSVGHSGEIDIEARNLTMADEFLIYAGSEGTGNSGSVRVTTSEDIWFADGANIQNSVRGQGNAGNIDILARDVTFTGYGGPNNPSGLLSGSRADGKNSGIITLNVRNLSLLDSAAISSDKIFSGQGGGVFINASDTITIHGPPSESGGRTSQVDSTGRGNGQSGNIVINARVLDMLHGDIFNNSIATGQRGGTITINVSESIVMRDFSSMQSVADFARQGGDILVTTGSLEMDFSAISTNIFGNSEQAGSIEIIADSVTLTGGAAIQAESCDCASGNAGDITMNIAGLLSVSGIDSGGFLSAIRSRTNGSGNGGEIDITAESVHLFDQGNIQTSSSSTRQDFLDDFIFDRFPGNAGNIRLTTGELTMESGASIRTEAADAAGGSIFLDVSGLMRLTDARISAEALGLKEGSNGGNLFITGPSAIILDKAEILASANAGNGGNIDISTDVLIPGFESIIDASSQTGLDGEVVIDSPNQQVTGVAALEAPNFDVSELLQDPCAIEVLDNRSSLTVEGKGGLPPVPGDFESAYESGSTHDMLHADIAGLYDAEAVLNCARSGS